MRYSVSFLLQLTAVAAIHIALWIQDSIFVCGTPFLFSGCLVLRDVIRGKTGFPETVRSSGLYTLAGFWLFMVLPLVLYSGYAIAFMDTGQGYFSMATMFALLGSYVYVFAGVCVGLGYGYLLWFIKYMSARKSS